ncbi:MAG: HAD family phosphatase [Anaerolineales bacterium]|nr:HAD family phosphatase [Anaerolineales bacterium]
MSIRGILFDLDGVLIRSEELALQAWNEMLSQNGQSLSEIQYKQMIGTADTSGYVHDHFNLDMTREEIQRDHRIRVMRLLETDLEAMPGAEAILQAIQKRGFPLAIASNSLQAYVEKALQVSGLRPYFQAVVARDLVPNPKPAPDVYQQAARELGLESTVCLAVEDSPIGMQAALAAGTRCVVVPHSSLLDGDFSGAYARYNNLEEVHGALGSLLR